MVPVSASCAVIEIDLPAPRVCASSLSNPSRAFTLAMSGAAPAALLDPPAAAPVALAPPARSAPLDERPHAASQGSATAPAPTALKACKNRRRFRPVGI